MAAASAESMTALARTIVVTTDFSAASEPALDAAALLARQNHARVALVHVVVQEADPMITDPDPDEVAERARARLARLAETRFSGLEVEIAVPFARDAPRGICDHAARIGADLIVIATHGRTGLAHALIGSVAERVVRHAPCAVLATRGTRSHIR